MTSFKHLGSDVAQIIKSKCLAISMTKVSLGDIFSRLTAFCQNLIGQFFYFFLKEERGHVTRLC